MTSKYPGLPSGCLKHQQVIRSSCKFLSSPCKLLLELEGGAQGTLQEAPLPHSRPTRRVRNHTLSALELHYGLVEGQKGPRNLSAFSRELFRRVLESEDDQ